MSYPRYPAYKSPGSTLFGEIPEHWKVLRLKQTVTLRNEKVLALDVKDSYIGLENIEPRTGRWVDGTFESDAEGTANRFYQGDVLFGKLRPYLAKVYLCPYDGIASTECFVFKPERWSAQYFKYVLLSSLFIDAVNSSTYGAKMPRANWDYVGNMHWCVPPDDEQRAIAAFLERETAQIDALIAKQEQLIALLQEKRQALISHVVTKGLNPAAPMKESGIEWLGEIPAHLEATKLKHVSPEVTVGIVVTPAKYYVEAGIPCLRSLNIKPGYVDPSNLVQISEAANQLLAKSILNTGDIVAVGTGQPGTSAIIPQEFAGCNCIDLIIIRKSNRLRSEYLCYFLNAEAARYQYLLGSDGAIQQHFNVGTAQELAIFVPPDSEQATIVRWLEEALTTIDALIEKSQRAEALLVERRAALITAAVTGQIDVRGLV